MSNTPHRTIAGTLRDDAARYRLAAAAVVAEWSVSSAPLSAPEFDRDAHPPVALWAVGGDTVIGFTVPEVLFSELAALFRTHDVVTLGDVRAIGDGSFLLSFTAGSDTTHLTVEDLTTL